MGSILRTHIYTSNNLIRFPFWIFLWNCPLTYLWGQKDYMFRLGAKLFRMKTSLPHFQTSISNLLKNSSPSNLKMASISSSAKFTSLVTLHHHDFKVERLHMWWDFFSLDEKVRIKDDIGRAISLLTIKVNRDLLQALASFWDPVLRCLSIGGIDLVPTIEEYTTLLQVPSSPTQIYVPIQQYRANKELANFLGLKNGVVSL